MMKHLFRPGTQAPPTPVDHQAICHRLVGYDFPWELNRALELAVLRTFCVPRISQLLQETGKFVHRPQKRYDDTSLILGNILKWGYDSPQGRAAIARMNRIHQRFAINNEDFLYVLSTTIFEPIRWNERFGWRRFTAVEKQALFEFWCVVGRLMGITDIPTSYEALAAFNQSYEAKNFHYHPANQIVGDAVVSLMQSWVPAIAAPLVPTLVSVVLDEPMRAALGWSRPSPVLAQPILYGLQWGRKTVRFLPARRRAQFAVDAPNRTYPQGYAIETLGADDETFASPPSRCPFMKMRSLLKSSL